MTATKLVHVAFAGGLAVDVAVPVDRAVLLDAVVEEAVGVVRRLFQVTGEPRVLGVDASRTVPGRVTFPPPAPKGLDLAALLDLARPSHLPPPPPIPPLGR